jgi:WD40 repeat protein
MTSPSARPEPEPASQPFVGLAPYGEEDAPFFFGRETEKRIVAGNLRASGLTLLYGASGVGKTSLLRAGVIHDLRLLARESVVGRPERPLFAICAFAAWRDDPLAALMEAIRLSVTEAVGSEDVVRWIPGEPPEETLRAWTQHVRTLLVVLDQFEDYFLYHPEEDGEGTFSGEFPGLVNDPNLRVHFLLSIREDALAKLDRFKGRIPRLLSNYVRVEHLSRPAAREAIEGPVREWNRRLPSEEPPYTVEPALVDAVVDAAAAGTLALVEGGGPAGAAIAGPEPVELPFLQLVMERLWRATVEAGARELTLARLDALGGPERIVENHLLEALARLTPEEQSVAADLFRFLVTRSKAKIAHPVSDLAEWTRRSEPQVAEVLEKLCRREAGRIVRRVPPPPTGQGETRYELFHDVLAEPILEWRREYEQEQRRRAAFRRFVRVGGVLLGLAAVFAALGTWALVQRSEARTATRSATSLALASEALAQLSDHSELSLLLGLEAIRANSSAEASNAMLAALEASRRSGAEAILRGGAEGVRTIAYSPDGGTLASADFDGTLRLWDTKARAPLGRPFRAHANEVWGLSFSPDAKTLASSSFDGTVRLWNVQDQRPLGPPIDAHVGAVRSVAFSPDGRTVAFAGSDDSVRLWDVSGFEEAHPPLLGHRSSVMSIAYSPDGRTLASGGADRTVRLWDVSTGEQLGRTLAGHTGKVVSVAFSPDGRTLASSDLAGNVRLWDVDKTEPRGEPLRGRTGQVWSVAFSPDGKTLASSGFDGTVRLWDARTGRVSGEPLRGHSRAAIALAYASDGTLASSSYDGTVRLWNVRRRHLLGDPIGKHSDRVTAVAVSPDGRTLASGGFDRTVRLWDLEARRPLGSVRGGDELDSIESLEFSPDGRTLAVADVDGSIWLVSVPGGASIGRLTGHDGAVQSVAFGPDGTTLASAGFDGTVRLWDVPAGQQIREPLAGHEGPVWAVAFSADGGTLASACSDGTLRLWDVTGHRAAGVLPLAEGEVVQTLAFATDGRTLASGSVGGNIRLWDARARRPLGEGLDGHAPHDVEHLVFGPDGRLLASAGGDGTVRLWDARGRRALGPPLRGHAGPVFGVAFAPDGRTLVSGGDDRTVRAWERILWTSLADLEAQVCELVVGNLTRSEWEALVPGLAYRTTCGT